MLGLPKRFFGRDKPPENPAAPQHQGTQHVPFKQWVHVESSNLEAIWYDPENEILRIRFNPEDSHGQRQGVRSYAYSMVPMRVFLDLLNAPSKGKYHAKHIKWNYPYTQLGYLDG